MMLNRPTWIFPARSGSSLMAKMPRLARGKQAVVNGQFVGESRPPRAALMGSTSPIMSAMVTSGVASFST